MLSSKNLPFCNIASYTGGKRNNFATFTQLFGYPAKHQRTQVFRCKSQKPIFWDGYS